MNSLQSGKEGYNWLHSMKPILFIDFDGTLCHDRFWQNYLSDEAFKKISIFTSRRDITRAWMRGEYTSEEINAIVAKETGIPSIWIVFNITSVCLVYNLYCGNSG